MNNRKSGAPFAKKSFGQNFLVDGNYIDKIIGALKPTAGETVIEIGAGRGALTEKLIESGAKVIAIELERDMIHALHEQFGTVENLKIIERDALKVDFGELAAGEKIKLVANLPYYISTAILQKLIEQRERFSEMILMFQREVVERITAQVGDSERGFLTALTEAFLDAEKLFDVPPTAFRPSPKVNSAVVRLIPKAEIAIKDAALFRCVVSQAFMQKRKTIYNNLKNAQFKNAAEIDWANILAAAKIDPTRRAESLSSDDWVNLAAGLEKTIAGEIKG